MALRAGGIAEATKMIELGAIVETIDDEIVTGANRCAELLKPASLCESAEIAS